jgi:ligand-binding SRPBCC domain-containing protein
MLHRLYKKQLLPISLDEAWAFFSKPENLDRITPDDMHFEILTGADTESFPGQIITYKIKPFLNIPFYWVTEITQSEEKKYFIDEQRFGPYAFWHHMHKFRAVKDGVLMEDILHYKLPFGFLGDWMGKLFLHKKVQSIFDHREKMLKEYFKAASVPTNDRQPMPKTES